jgi:ABC-type bacteriocin/lantibiotic exporter with double-glycine peptidase domain
MLLSHFDIQATEAELRACCQTTEQGTLAREAVSCLTQQYGLQAKEWHNAQWAELQTILTEGSYPITLINLFPLKALWVMHAVVIESIRDEQVFYLDPIYGEQAADLISFEQAWEMNGR